MKIDIDDNPARGAAQALVEAIQSVLANQERCVLATAGGRTPAPVLDAIGPYVDERVVLTLVDERHTSDPALQNSALLNRVHGVQRLSWVVDGTLGHARDVLEARIPNPDVLLLGMGEDGHIASLFPGSPALLAGARILGIDDSPKPPATRLTMSMELLRRASSAIVLITGAAKADSAARSLQHDPSLPLTALSAPGGPDMLWFLDSDAAQHLSRSPNV